MNKGQLSKVLALFALVISAYLAHILIKDISSVYNNALAWFDGDKISAIGFSIVVGSALISSLLISFLIYRGSHTYWILLPLMHTVFVFASIPVYVLVLTVLVWLGSKYAWPTN
jgi:hypothetical protein